MIPLAARPLLPSRLHRSIRHLFNATCTLYSPPSALSSPPAQDSFGQPLPDTGPTSTGAEILRADIPCRVYTSALRMREEKHVSLTLDVNPVTVLLSGNHTDITDSMTAEVTGYSGDVTRYDILSFDIDSEGINTKLVVRIVRI